jgi:hypothetical protein
MKVRTKVLPRRLAQSRHNSVMKNNRSWLGAEGGANGQGTVFEMRRKAGGGWKLKSSTT